MTRILNIFLMASALLGFSSCHETIHIHPWEEPAAHEAVRLSLHIDNDAPQLGAVIDYTVSPAVIIFSDDLPETALRRARMTSRTPLRENSDAHEQLLQRAHALADALDEIAPYALDGDKWEIHLKYEVYAGTAQQVGQGLATLLHSNDVKYRADTPRPGHDVEAELPFGDVTVVAVAHIVPVGTDRDWFFNTTTLHNLICDMDKRQGEHDNVYRDCFAVAQEFHVEPTGIDGNVQHLSATLTRPQGRYKVIADDYETYLGIANADIERAVSHIHYPSYINVAYSVLTHNPLASSFDFGYDHRPSLSYVKGSPYVHLGDDWSFVNGDRSNFNIHVTVRDRDDDRVISHNPDILVPVFPGRITLVVGHWLTEINEGGGGITIDPDFIHEIIIHF